MTRERRYLLDSEKAWDRDRVLETLRVILALGYDILNYNEVKEFREGAVQKRRVLTFAIVLPGILFAWYCIMRNWSRLRSSLLLSRCLAVCGKR